MGWERRQRGGTYYTRSRRVAGRVVREYVGTGPLAELTAAVDADARAERAAARQRLLVERQRVDTVSAAVSAVADLAEALARVALVAAGYRRHDRGQWRKRRGAHDQAD